MKSKITAMVLTYNEEKRIGTVLGCLQMFDDIIVYDKSSTDKTCEIASEYGAKILHLPYYNDTPPDEICDTIRNAALTMQDSEWIFSIVASDIIHCDLYDEMIQVISYEARDYDVIDIPIYRYSMGACGKESMFGELQYKPMLIKRDVFLKNKPQITHQEPFLEMDRYKLQCKNRSVAVYHLTHENLNIVMERHWRYAIQYVEGMEKSGKNREAVMRYSWHEILRMIFSFFRHRSYRLKWTGGAQLMMLVMYNAMIYLNAYFDEEEEKKITRIYKEIVDKCKDKSF